MRDYHYSRAYGFTIKDTLLNQTIIQSNILDLSPLSSPLKQEAIDLY
jgi:hypothetical protein